MCTTKRFWHQRFSFGLKDTGDEDGALKSFAKTLSESGINTLVMEWEGAFPFEKHPLIPNRYAYTKDEIKSFI